MLKRAGRTQILLAIIEIFNGISAVVGGYFLIADKSGESIGFNLNWLQHTPFASFLLPGIILFVINGIGNLVAFVLTIIKAKKAGFIGAFLGLVMMMWIVMQVFWIGYTGFLQPLYLTTGLLQAVLGFSLMRLK